MTLTLELPEKLQRRLEEMAQQQHKTPEAVALETLRAAGRKRFAIALEQRSCVRRGAARHRRRRRTSPAVGAMTFLTVGDVLALHDEVLRASGGSAGVRDAGAVESAVAQPQAAFGGQELYPTLADKAAALSFSLVKNHAFVDGNKRIGWAAMRVFSANQRIRNRRRCGRTGTRGAGAGCRRNLARRLDAMGDAAFAGIGSRSMTKKLLLAVALFSLAQLPPSSAARSRRSARVSHRHASAAPLASLKGRLLVRRDYKKGSKQTYFLYSMKPDGSDQRRLLPTKGDIPNEQIYLYDQRAISPDGRFVVFGSGYAHRNSFRAADVTAELYLYTVKTGTAKRFTNDGYGIPGDSPQFSSDGKKILFVTSEWQSADVGSSWIYIMNRDGSNKTKLTEGGVVRDARFIGDGTKIYYVLIPSDSYHENWIHLYVMNADGSQQTLLPEDEAQHQFNRDGERVAFLRKTEEGSKLVVRNVDGSDERKIASLDKPLRLVKASNDLRLFYFESFIEQPSPESTHRFPLIVLRSTYLISADGKVRPLATRAQSPSYITGVAFSPDSRKVAYSSQQNGHWQIFTMNADGSGKKQLTDNEADDAVIGWL